LHDYPSIFLIEQPFNKKRLRDLFIANFREAGKDEPEVDAYVLYSLIEGTIQQYLLEPEQYPLENMVERIVEQFGSS